MAAKSVIQIEVDDSKFKEFKSLFDDYKAALSETPELWVQSNEQIEPTIQASQALTDDAQTRLQLLQATATEEKKQAETQRKYSDDRKKRDNESIKRWKELGKTIASATAQLAKFSAIGLGIASGASAFGFNKLTQDASYTRFQSMGLGVSNGAMQAANINYQSALANPAANLAAIRDAQQDLTKQKLFLTAGISNYQNKTTDELLPDLLVATQKMAKATPQSQLAQVSQAYGYSDVFTQEDLTRFKQMSEAEMQAMIAKAQQDKQNLAVNDATLKTYQDLQKQWDRFSQGMENTWIKALEPLAPVLTKFSESVEKAFKTLLETDKLSPLINGLADGIEDFSKYLVSPEFTNDFDTFMHWLDVAGGYIHQFAKGMGWLADKLGIGGEVTLTGSQYKAIDSSGLSDDVKSLATEYLENPSQQKNLYYTQKFAEQAEEAAKTDSQVYDKLKKLGIDIGKPMSAEQYKQARDDEFQRMSGAYLDKMGTKFEGALTSWWGKAKAVSGDVLGVAGDIAGAVGNAIIPTASAEENAAISKMKPDDKANYAMQKFIAMGYTKEQAAGIAANLHRESKFNTSIVGDGGAAYGIGQWHKDRQRNFEKVFGHSIKGSTLDEQLKFVDWELKNTESRAGEKLAKASSAKEAGAIVSKYYERPLETEKEMRERGGHASVLASAYNPTQQISQSDYKGTPFVTKKDENGNLITVKRQKIKDTYALNKPTPEQQQSVMFQQQGGIMDTTRNRVQIQINNATGGNTNVSALSL